MEDCPIKGKSRDILTNPWLALSLFWVPAIAIAVTASTHNGIGNGWKTAVWTAALVIMGTACVANSIRCGRVHCYVTGPFFLLMALASLLYGVGLLRLGAKGWNLIALTILAGAIVLCCLPELFLGKYRKDNAPYGEG